MNEKMVIGITGASGSGKTTLLKDIREAFTPEELAAVSQDNYYHPRSNQKFDENEVVNFDLPTSLDLMDFHHDVRGLVEGRAIRRPEYVYNNDLKTPGEIIIQPAPVIVLEGLFLFVSKEIFDLCDLTIYVHAKPVHNVIRRIKRDQMERNYPIDDVLYRYERHVHPSFEEYILPFKEDADIVVNNNAHMERSTAMIIGYIRDYLNSI